MRQCHGHLPLAGRIMVLCSNISSIALAGRQETVTVQWTNCHHCLQRTRIKLRSNLAHLARGAEIFC